MNKYALLQAIQRLYKNSNVNIIQYLKKIANSEQTCLEDIMISYDFQAGTYIDAYLSDSEWTKNFLSRFVRILKDLPGRKRTIFEPGVGEATTLVPFLNLLENEVFAGGGDISWSRIKVGQKFAYEYLNRNLKPLPLVMADMFSLPLANNSVDVVYTVHAMEPNGGHEAELLRELYRVTNEYLILLEPAYELATPKAKERMERNGYVRGLYQTAIALGYDVLTWELYGKSSNPLNPTGIMIIQKHPQKEAPHNLEYVCPITSAPLELIGNAYYSKESLLAYPVINDVPCLIKDYAIVATKLPNFSGA